MGKLDGRVAIITGASRGIGRDMAAVLAREGAKVALAARTLNEGDSRIEGSLITAVERIRADGGQAIGVRCDVTNDQDLQELVNRTVSEFGKVDILVSNAGVLVPGGFLGMQIRHFDLSYRMRVRAPFVLTRLVVPHMIEQGWGHLIYFSSGDEPFIRGLTEELRDKNVAVNRLRLGKSIVTEGGNFFRGTTAADMKGWRVNAEIMGDAAALIAGKEPRTFTGNVVVDEEIVLANGGNLDKYPVIPE
ncbi:MAG: SDR family NAD(P)-dependent oxidoreductase [Chloroflexi bacterium]|nr:SDR family NAD(P)-dependent oxidoreductase [Chloroflexota bacterium]